MKIIKSYVLRLFWSLLHKYSYLSEIVSGPFPNQILKTYISICTRQILKVYSDRAIITLKNILTYDIFTINNTTKLYILLYNQKQYKSW